MKVPRVLALAMAAMLAASAAFAGVPRLVRDINPTIIPVDSNPAELIDQGSWSLFVGRDGVHHGEPWATDGTTAGTVSLGSVTPFDHETSGNQTVRAGGFTYLFSTGQQLQPVLYRLDGTAAGTRIVKDFGEVAQDGYLVGALGSLAIFSMFETDKGREFWRSDGTEAGTSRITDVGGPQGYAIEPVIANGKLYFLAIDFDTHVVEPWVSDGTTAGTHRLMQLPNVGPIVESIDMVRVGNYLVFTANTTTTGTELWRIDLSNDAVSLLKDIAPGSASAITYARFGGIGNVAIFMASATGGTQAMWRTDGTTAGTFQVSSLIPMSDAPDYYESSTEHRLLFRVFVSNDDVQLWSTDGTTVTPLDPPGPSFLGTVGGTVYFSSGTGLWRSDGTLPGTKRLTGLPAELNNVQIVGSDTQVFVRASAGKTVRQWRYDLATESALLLRTHTLGDLGGIQPNLFGYGQGKLYFDSVDPVTGRELYVSDGTTAGTRLLRNLAPETRSQPSDPRDLFEFDGKLYFTADDGISGRELWVSDGTQGGTQLVIDIAPGTESSNPLSLFTLAGKLYFFARDVANGNSYKMYTTDGTAAGTHMVVAAIPREALYGGQTPCGATVATLGGHAYLNLYELGFTTSLWRTDGTAAGTVRFQDTSAIVSDPCWLTAFKGRNYFAATQYDTVGNELFSAAPGATPSVVVDFVPGTQGTSPVELTVFNDRLYFMGMTAAGMWKIFSTDGVAAGVTALDSTAQFPNNLRVANGKLFFLHTSPVYAGGVPLLAGDGTTAGTARVGTIGVFGPLFSNGARVFFSGTSPANPTLDVQPWVSDGTNGGTFSLASGAFPEASQIYFWDFHGATILQVHQADGEAQLWRTDGTVAGTRLLGDAGVAAQNHYPVKHMAAGQTFYFVADKDGSGTELFAVDNERPLAANDAGGSVQAGVALPINVAANDTDADGSVRASTALVATAPAHGSALVGTNGVITYTGNAGYTGTDSFTYTVADDQGARSAAATVSVTVTAPPAAPPPPPASGGGGGGGGGGALGLFELLLLGALRATFPLRRRTRAIRALI